MNNTLGADYSKLYRQASVRRGEAAAFLEVSSRTIWNMIQDGRLELHGQTNRITSQSLRAHLLLPAELDVIATRN